MTANWIHSEESIYKWEHLTETGTFLVFENKYWKIIRNGRILTQNKNPSCPFRWGEDIIKQNQDYWGER